MSFASSNTLLHRLSAAYPSISFANSNTSYLQSYPSILKHFLSLTLLSEADFTVAAHIVYGWMPTVLTLNTLHLSAATMAAQVARDGKRPLESEEIIRIAQAVNNSLVGASKLLHFLNPEQYPIWDTRVARFFFDKPRVHHYQVNDITAYSRYAAECRALILTTDFQVIHEDINRKLQEFSTYGDKPITRLRSAELIMFLA